MKEEHCENIHIIVNNFFGYVFTEEDCAKTYMNNLLYTSFAYGCHCSNSDCSNLIADKYYFIIKKLQRADLLPEDFKMLCCSCFKFENFIKNIRFEET